MWKDENVTSLEHIVQQANRPQFSAKLVPVSTVMRDGVCSVFSSTQFGVGHCASRKTLFIDEMYQTVFVMTFSEIFEWNYCIANVNFWERLQIDHCKDQAKTAHIYICLMCTISTMLQ